MRAGHGPDVLEPRRRGAGRTGLAGAVAARGGFLPGHGRAYPLDRRAARRAGLPEATTARIAGPAAAIAAVTGEQDALGQVMPLAVARALTAALGQDTAADGIWQGLAARRARPTTILTGAGWVVLAASAGPGLVARPPAAWQRDNEAAAHRLLDLAGVLALPLSAHCSGGEPRDALAFRFDRPSGDIEAAARRWRTRRFRRHRPLLDGLGRRD